MRKGIRIRPEIEKRFESCTLKEESGLELRGVRSTWRGRLPNVWVTSDNALKDLLEIGPEHLNGLRAYDALGLSWDWNRGKPELVAVKYPPQFDEAFTQPTTLDASWKDAGHQYLSYVKHDHWRRPSA